MDCMKVGKLILQLRTEKGLTQKQVADLLNISNKTISKWESGGTSPDLESIVCGNILTSTGAASIACCGRQLQPLTPDMTTPEHTPLVEEVDAEYYATVPHEMRREHYLLFAACVNDDRVWLNRLYPEQSPNFRFPYMGGGGSLYLYCTKHGLMKYKLNVLLNRNRQVQGKQRQQ